MVSKKRINLTQSMYITFEQVFEEYVLDCKARGLAKDSISSIYGHIKPVTRGFDVQMPITQVDWKRVYALVYAREDIAPNTAAGYLRAMKCVINFANKTYDLNLPKPVIKVVESVKETYTDEELKLLISKPKKFESFCDYRNWLIVCTLVDTGIRAATVRNILIKDIDFAGCSLTTRHNKTKKVQVIPLSKHLTRELFLFVKAREGEGEEFLFCDVYGGQLSANGLKLAIRRYNFSRGVNKTGTHMFRHTFARKFLVDKGGDALVLQKWLGHSTLEMTKNYCRLYDKDLLQDKDSILDSLQHHKKHL